MYTGVRNFPMLPEQLSTGTSSLLETEDKLSIMIEFVAGSDGSVRPFKQCLPTHRRNMAQLICTLKEDAARKVEREMSKRIPAVAMTNGIGETFDAMVTAVTSH